MTDDQLLYRGDATLWDAVGVEVSARLSLRADALERQHLDLDTVPVTVKQGACLRADVLCDRFVSLSEPVTVSFRDGDAAREVIIDGFTIAALYHRWSGRMDLRMIR